MEAATKELIQRIETDYKITLDSQRNNVFFWNHQIAVRYKLTEEFMTLYLENFHLATLVEYQNITPSFIRRNKYQLSWHTLSFKYTFSTESLREFKEVIKWSVYCRRKGVLSEEQIEEFEDYVHWYFISGNQTLSEAFILKHKEKLDMVEVSRQKLSAEFIYEYRDELDWEILVQLNTLPESLLRKVIDIIDAKHLWYGVSANQKLSEAFIEDYSEKVFWNAFYNRDFSYEFIIKHIDKLNLNDLLAEGKGQPQLTDNQRNELREIYHLAKRF